MMDKCTTTFSGVCELLERQVVTSNSSTAYPMARERSHDGSCSIENCLSDYTDLEVMDDDNMFICTECNRKHQEKVGTTIYCKWERFAVLNFCGFHPMKFSWENFCCANYV